MHKVPEFFNNDLVTPTSVMKDYPIRYQSLGVNYFTLNTRLYNSALDQYRRRGLHLQGRVGDGLPAG